MKTLHTIQRKRLYQAFNWKAIDKKKALKPPHLLDLVREACLIESYFAIYTGKMMELFWYDVSATSVLSIEAYEAFTHYAILRRYLEVVGYKPLSDAEIVALRDKDKGKVYTDEIRELVNFMMTEHFAAQFFRDISRQTEEPVLKKILWRFASEEEIHSRFAFDLLKVRLENQPEVKAAVLNHVRHFQHIGAYVLPQVSKVKDDNLRTILSFNKKMEKLLGQRLSDFLGRRRNNYDFKHGIIHSELL